MAETCHLNDFFLVETKRHKPSLIFAGYRYVQDKIQNQTIYWRCEDRVHCHGRAHQHLGIASSLPIRTRNHNHPAIFDDLRKTSVVPIDGQRRQRRHRKLFAKDDLFLSSSSSRSQAMTSPIKLENHLNRQQYLQHLHHHGSVAKNLHLSEVITTAANNHQHYNGMGLHRHSAVDPIEMNKLLNNITTSSNAITKPVSTSSNMDYSSRLNHFSWEEIEGRYLPVIFRNENGCLQRYTSKMFVENTLFQSESWQRHANLARSLPPLISFPYTDHELKLFRLIVEWHLASFHFKTILPSDCLIRYEDLLDFYGALRKLRDTVSSNSFNRPLPPPPMPPPMSMGPPKQRLPSTGNGALVPSFELPTMGGNAPMKSHLHPRSQSASKVYPSPGSLHPAHSSNYLLQQSVDLLNSFPTSSSASTHPFHYNAVSTTKSNLPSSIPHSTPQWTETMPKGNEKMRAPMPVNSIADKQIMPAKVLPTSRPSVIESSPVVSRETKESGWVQINNVFVPYIVKLKLRENEFEKCSTRQFQREFYVPYEILIKCHIFADQEFAFKKFLVKANQQDFDIFNSLISNINIFDDKSPEKTLLVNLYHVMMGLQKILYVKLLTSKQPRTQVNKYHADVLTHKGGTLLMSGNKIVPYILQNNRFYVPLMYSYQSAPHILSQAKRGARAPRQYEIDYLNLLFLYFSIDSPPFTSDTLLVDAYTIKCANYQPPIHFRTLNEHQQFERNRLLATITRTPSTSTKVSTKPPPMTTKAAVGPSSQKFNKCPPANVVVNPLIHHPSFYGLAASTSTMKPTPSSSPTISALPPSNSVVINPLLLPSNNTSESLPPPPPPPLTKLPSSRVQIKTIKYDHQTLNALVKSPHTPANDWKISIRHIFEQFAFQIDYQKFIQWCQTNSLLPLVQFDDEEKDISLNNNDDDFYVYQRHLDRCIALLNDLKRGTISMTLLPPSTNHDGQSSSSTLVKSPLAGAKKRKTTVPTTRHISAVNGSSSPSNNVQESTVSSQEIDHRSPELAMREVTTPPLTIADTETNMMTTTERTAAAAAAATDDDPMPVVASVEEQSAEMDSSFLIVESTEGEDGKIQLDDTLPSCSSGYESAPAVTNVDNQIPHHPSSDDDDDDEEEDETHSTVRSREHSSSTCQSEHSLTPILSTVSSNIQLHPTDEDEDDDSNQSSKQKKSSPVSTSNNHQTRQRDRHGKYRVRSRSPTPRHAKKKRLAEDLSPSLPSANTITSDQIEHHLRTLLMPGSDQHHQQRRTRTRPIKTPTRLVEEIASNHSMRPIETDSNVFEILSTSPTNSTDTSIMKNNSQETTSNPHQSCTYNVTISNKPNKLGLTIKKVLPR